MSEFEQDFRKLKAQVQTMGYENELRRENNKNNINPLTEGEIQQRISKQRVQNERRQGI